eukprot:scaffold14885_cov65-Phaeocystis_antarctica.AAC.10
MYCNNQTPVRKMRGLVYVYRCVLAALPHHQSTLRFDIRFQPLVIVQQRWRAKIGPAVTPETLPPHTTEVAGVGDARWTVGDRAMKATGEWVRGELAESDTAGAREQVDAERHANRASERAADVEHTVPHAWRQRVCRRREARVTQRICVPNPTRPRVAHAVWS